MQRAVINVTIMLASLISEKSFHIFSGREEKFWRRRKKTWSGNLGQHWMVKTVRHKKRHGTRKMLPWRRAARGAATTTMCGAARRSGGMLLRLACKISKRWSPKPALDPLAWSNSLYITIEWLKQRDRFLRKAQRKHILTCLSLLIKTRL